MLSKNQLNNVCLVGQGYKCCRFLAQDDNDWTKHYCIKTTGRRKEIDKFTEKHIKECSDSKTDVTQSNIPLGDNCTGYPIMKYIEQGYDIP